MVPSRVSNVDSIPGRSMVEHALPAVEIFGHCLLIVTRSIQNTDAFRLLIKVFEYPPAV